MKLRFHVKRALRALGRHARRNPQSLAGKVLTGVVRQFGLGYHNVLFDAAENGETRLAAFAARRLKVGCVFDVGANVGDWTEMALSAFPGAVVHCFEPMPENARRLEARFVDEARVVVNPVGLGAERATRSIVFVDDGLQTTATTASAAGVRSIEGAEAFSETLEIPLVAAADYAAEHGIERIDFLKIDVEGGDYFVLTGLGDLLGAATPCIQFEFTIFTTVNRVWLRDFIALLEAAGYRVYRIFPDWLERVRHDPVEERNPDGNFAALHESAFGEEFADEFGDVIPI